MVRGVLILILIGLGRGFASVQPEIRVRLKKHQQVLELSGLGIQVSPFTSSEKFQHLSIRQKAPHTWELQWEGEKIPLVVNCERLLVRGQMLRLGPEPVPENLEIRPSSARGMDVIAHVDLENYLLGVIPSEMPADWPYDALKAQVVSARSFVLRQTFERKRKPFDVEATILDQVFRKEQTAQSLARVKRAIVETRGEILVDSRKAVIKAFYSADCGCQSEDPKFVWGEVDVYQSVKDPTCHARAPLQWSSDLPREEVAAKLLNVFDLPTGSNLLDLEVGRRTPSGRVRDLLAHIDVDGAEKILSLNSQQFRKLFGFQKIRSTDFSLKWEDDRLEVRGRGAGHGVGLCQRGAHTLANEGVNYRDILKMYYPKARLVSPLI